MKIDAGTKDFLILAAILGLVVLAFKDELAALVNGGFAPGDPTAEVFTCYDGSTGSAAQCAADHGGLAPLPCQGITDPTEFYQCMERNV